MRKKEITPQEAVALAKKAKEVFLSDATKSIDNRLWDGMYVTVDAPDEDLTYNAILYKIGFLGDKFIIAVIDMTGLPILTGLELDLSDKFEDLAASNALVRPGAMNTVGASYIKRKHGNEAVKFIHPINNFVYFNHQRSGKIE
jgi:hypothetical protein